MYVTEPKDEKIFSNQTDVLTFLFSKEKQIENKSLPINEIIFPITVSKNSTIENSENYVQTLVNGNLLGQNVRNYYFSRRLVARTGSQITNSYTTTSNINAQISTLAKL